ncbi:MAG: endolytic transglycosylase MltG [Pseudomonadota bacterium]
MSQRDYDDPEQGYYRESNGSGHGHGADRGERPPRRRRRRSTFVSVLSGLFTLLVVLAIAFGALLGYGQISFTAEGPLTEERAVMIPRGQGVRTIAETLHREGVIASPWIFIGGVLAYKAQGKLQAGEFIFPARASMSDVMDRLAEGRAILHRLTVPEGLTTQQILRLVEEHPILAGEVTLTPVEGELMPETYKFSRGTTRDQVVRQMVQAKENALEEAWANRAPGLPLENPRELLILASIVEKETGKAEERPKVAGVFINRLNRGMKLQSDPTILYGLYGGDAWVRPRIILRSELDAPDNPYNTYQIDRLPPGPIANVGRAALEAVAQPEETDALFFVADGTGGHAFATTLEDHNRNVAEWRKIERQREAATAAGDESSQTSQ